MSIPKIAAAYPRNVKTLQHAKIKPEGSSSGDSIYPNNKVYLSGLTIAKEFPRDKIIEQNKKLKKQVQQLSQHMEDVIGKGIQKKKYGINLGEELEAGTPQQNNEIKQQESRLAELRGQIFNLKKENQYVWCESAVVEKQNAIKALEAEMKPFEVEKAGLDKIRREQEKALNFRKNDNQLNQKIQKTKSQLAKVKDQCKILAIKIQENQKLLLKAHSKTVSKNKKIKEVEERIRENKQKLKKGEQNIVTMEMIGEIEDQINRLEAQYKEMQKQWGEKISNLQAQQNSRRVEEEKKLIILKEKQKEVKLNDIRMKQFRKLIVQSRAEQKSQKEEGTRQFRHKRNIKYLEKKSQ